MFTSPEHQGKTPEGRSDGGPIILKERKLSADSLTRFYIPLSLHHYLGLPEQTVLDEREQVKVQPCGTFEQVNQGIVSNESSPSRHSLPESEEITFDSSGSSTPEAWSISHTSSYCELTSPFWFSLVSVEKGADWFCDFCGSRVYVLKISAQCDLRNMSYLILCSSKMLNFVDMIK